MVSRRFSFAVALVTTAGCFFLLGDFHARAGNDAERAEYDAKLDAIRAEVRHEIGRVRTPAAATAGTSGAGDRRGRPAAAGRARPRQAWSPRSSRISRTRWACCRCSCCAIAVRASSSSTPTDNFGKTSYGTAGYLGDGYFITVKHAVVALKDDDDRDGQRKIVSIKVIYQGKEVPASLIDAGDADVEVHPGDWAIIRTKPLDLPALHADTGFAYDFAEPIFRLGNDYSKGIILSTGYVGQRTPNGLVTCLTDGHPGVSGGGVLDRAATWSASRSAGCRATSASRSSCRSAPRCCARSRRRSRPPARQRGSSLVDWSLSGRWSVDVAGRSRQRSTISFDRGLARRLSPVG